MNKKNIALLSLAFVVGSSFISFDQDNNLPILATPKAEAFSLGSIGEALLGDELNEEKLQKSHDNMITNYLMATAYSSEAAKYAAEIYKDLGDATASVQYADYTASADGSADVAKVNNAVAGMKEFKTSVTDVKSFVANVPADSITDEQREKMEYFSALRELQSKCISSANKELALLVGKQALIKGDTSELIKQLIVDAVALQGVKTLLDSNGKSISTLNKEINKQFKIEKPSAQKKKEIEASMNFNL